MISLLAVSCFKMAASNEHFVSADFEVFGMVQGVFFRKFTRDTARHLGIVGWVRNTEDDTVDGIIQGPQSKVAAMKEWLSTKGSPYCRIDRAEFRNERKINKLDFSDFRVRH